MRIAIGLCVTVMFLLSLAGAAQAIRLPAADGNIRVDAGDGVTRDIKFNVKIEADGSTRGDMTFADPSVPADFDPDNADAGQATGLLMQVAFDCLVVDGNRAVMGGVVVESTLASRVGERVLFTVEDNGEGTQQAEPDRLGWGVYVETRKTWVPADGELESDDGASRHWIATDAEREDDVGVPTGEPISQSLVVDCETFPLQAYALVDIQEGHGNIQIKEP